MRPIDADELYTRLMKRYLMHNMKDDRLDMAARAAIGSCMEAVNRSKTITITKPPNDPLTLEELREMDGGTGVVREIRMADLLQSNRFPRIPVHGDWRWELHPPGRLRKELAGLPPQAGGGDGMAEIKPILFRTDMVRAILNGTKTVTRRVVRPQLKTKCSHGGQHEFIQDDFIEWVNFTGFVCRKCGYGVCGPHFKFPVGTSWIRPPYRPGDILYVRETWAAWSRTMGTTPALYYKADGNAPDGIKWHPSIHMPREAARIFLRVTDVRVKRLQDITEEQALSEGARKEYQHYYDNVVTAREFFSGIWNSTIKPADRACYGWDANPWVWVIEFERCEKPGGE